MYMYIYTYLHIYTHIHIHLYIYIYVYVYTYIHTTPARPPTAWRQQASVWPALRLEGNTPNLPTNIVDFRGFDSSTILIYWGEILRPIGDFPESLSQAMLVGTMLVGRLGVITLLCLIVVLFVYVCY